MALQPVFQLLNQHIFLGQRECQSIVAQMQCMQHFSGLSNLLTVTLAHLMHVKLNWLRHNLQQGGEMMSCGHLILFVRGKLLSQLRLASLTDGQFTVVVSSQTA